MAVVEKNMNKLEAMKAEIDSLRTEGRIGASWENYAVAHITLREDLGEFGQSPGLTFDEHVRDQLIAHARQDVAHAVSNTTSILSQLRTIRIMLIVCLAGVGACFLLLALR